MQHAFNFIIRTSGERTTQLCINYHKRLFPNANLIVTGDSGLPQWKNLYAFLNILGQTTTPSIVCDSDIFLTNTSLVDDLLREVELQRHHIKMAVHCQFFGPVFRGAYFFSSRIGKEMNGILLNGDFDLKSHDFIIRPLRTLVSIGMTGLGLNPEEDSDSRLIGIHDYGQFRKHIFHKFIYRAWREHRKSILQLNTLWANHPDPDFRVASKGLTYGLNHPPNHIGHAEVSDLTKDICIIEKSNSVSHAEKFELIEKTQDLVCWETKSIDHFLNS